MTFKQLNLIPALGKAVADAGYETPSPIQAKAIPPVLEGRDLLGCAQTGTGKTAAFALPILQLLANHPTGHNKIRALILTPTRELALQIGESFSQYGKYLTLRHLVIFGGVGQQPQVDALKKGVDILIACPGRLNDLMGQGFVDLSRLEIFVLDEADRMLDMGFIHDVKKVIAKLPRRRQNLLFSATMPREIEQLASSFLIDPVSVKVDPVSSTVDRIQQSLYFVEKGDKRKLLPYLIQTLDVKNALVFSRTKHGANRIAQDLNKAGISAAAIHGNKSQTARVAALEGFKAGQTRVLVATDIAARGIDINDLSHVFNFDLPEVPETYVHRIGRTARAGADGTAISFCAPEEREYLAGIEKLNRKKIPVVRDHPWAKEGQTPADPSHPGQMPAGKSQARLPKAKEAPKQLPPKQAQGKLPGPREGQPKQLPPKQDRPKLVQSHTTEKENKVETNQPNHSAGEAPAQGLSASAKRRRRRRKAAQHTAEAASAPTAQPQQPAPVRAQKAPQGQKAAPSQKAPARPARTEAVPQSKAPRESKSPKENAQDPGLILIARKAPTQKFANFEEYMTAHGGETAPIVSWEDRED